MNTPETPSDSSSHGSAERLRILLVTETWSSDGSDQFPRMLADVNGDGYDDIVAISSGGVEVLLSTGSGWVTDVAVWASGFGILSGWTNNGMYPRFMADVNGDGMADLIACGQAGTTVLLSTGSGFVSNPALSMAEFGRDQSWDSDWRDQYPRMAADINGDGRADIVGFGRVDPGIALAQFAQ